jgi:hypothetical protein
MTAAAEREIPRPARRATRKGNDQLPGRPPHPKPDPQPAPPPPIEIPPRPEPIPEPPAPPLTWPRRRAGSSKMRSPCSPIFL